LLDNQWNYWQTRSSAGALGLVQYGPLLRGWSGNDRLRVVSGVFGTLLGPEGTRVCCLWLSPGSLGVIPQAVWLGLVARGGWIVGVVV
jgi:hypothetical protein